MNRISVIVPLALPWEPVYRLPDGAAFADYPIGARVRVRISGREYVALVSGHDVPSELPPEKIHPCGPVEKGLERISEAEIRFWRALADYYLCTVGEVYKTAYPSLKTESEETAARVRERMQQRLEKLRADLQKKHRDNVRERIEAQIAALERTLDPTSQPAAPLPLVPLTERRQEAADAVRKAWKAGKTTVLLEGTDRSEVSMALAARCLNAGRSVLWLVPEIALSERLEAGIADQFPALVTYHSGMTAPRRRDVSETVRSAAPVLLVGTRSALMLPYRELGLIIVDDEHDPSYKQDSPDPRYNTRDAAILLAGIHGAKVLLGSATPSLETRYNALQGRFGRIVLVPEQPLPRQIELVDIPAERRKKGVYGLISRRLADSLRTASKALLICPTRSTYCTPELVEAELCELYASVPEGIRVGTQPDLLAEGLDYKAFDCVALLQGDALLLGEQDFRGDERAWQMLTRLLLRCRPGVRLLIQTTRAAHPLWQYFLDGDSEGFYNTRLAERQAAAYPPYSRLVDISIRDNAVKRLDYMSAELAREIAAALPAITVDGPFTPQRPDSETLRQLRLIFPRDRALPSRKQALAALIRRFETARRYTSHLTPDVDPQ
ncbi:MAG: hypothetical protein LIQ26_02760 [Bacteroidota bacterium]|nr:hypothetical protein [Bacteroidota bacterium]